MSSTRPTLLSKYFADRDISDAHAFCSDIGSSATELATAAQYLRSKWNQFNVGCIRTDPAGHALAKNPALPPQEIVALVLIYPDFVAQNPSLPLHLATGFDFLRHLDPWEIAKLLRSKYLSPSLRRALMGGGPYDSQRRGIIALLCPVDMIGQFVGDIPSVRRMLALNKRLPTAVQYRLALDPDRKVRAGIAANPAADLSVLDFLIQPHECREVMRELVRNDNTSTAQLERLMAAECEVVRDIASERLAYPKQFLKAKHGPRRVLVSH